VSNNHLINPDCVHKFIRLVHRRAAAAIDGIPNRRPAVLQLCSNSPGDRRFYTSAFHVGDVDHMTEAALIDSRAGKNVYIEPRLVRPGRPTERGGLNATLAVFAAVADSDFDRDKPFAAPIMASAAVETSPQNEHSWYFLKRAIGADDAQEFGRLMRQSGGDSCSGNPVQPFRVAGTANFPDQQKITRGRIPVATRIQFLTNRTYTLEELQTAFRRPADNPQCGMRHPPLVDVAPAAAFHSGTYSRSMAKMILAAEPGADRSAAFMSAINHAARGGLTADEFEILARHYPDGCAGKYFESGDRLRQEIERCFSKIGR
jgi:hypothetical protein